MGEFTYTQTVVGFVRRNNKAMQRHRILRGNPIWEKPWRGKRIHYFQDVTVNFAELKLCDNFRLQWDSGLRRMVSTFCEKYSFVFSLFSSSISQCIYTHESSLAVQVMWISIIAWSARCDSFIMAWLCSWLWVISAIFCNNLRWSRSCCNVWNVRWPGSVTYSMNVDGYQWGRLLRPSCSWQEGLILKWRRSRKECPRG